MNLLRIYTFKMVGLQLPSRRVGLMFEASVYYAVPGCMLSPVSSLPIPDSVKATNGTDSTKGIFGEVSAGALFLLRDRMPRELVLSYA